MRDDEILEICRKLKPVVGRKADMLWLSYLTASRPEERNQYLAIIHSLSLKHLNGDVAHLPILLPPPTSENADGEFPLGRVIYQNKPWCDLYLRRENFAKHICILSITGGGKTNVAQLILLGILKAEIPFVAIDWKRSYRDLLSLPAPEVQNLTIYSVGRKAHNAFRWNPLRGPPGVNPKTWISVVCEAMERSHVSGMGVADVLIEILDREYEKRGLYDTDKGEPEQYVNFFDAMEALEAVQFKGRRMLWADSCLRILRTFTFGPASGAFNARNPIKLEDVLNKHVIFEIDAEMPKPVRIFFSELLLRWIHLYRLSQGETDQLRHVTLLEEVHNLFPKSNIEKQATNSLETLTREIRGFGEGLIFITQHPSLLPVYVLGNCNTQIYLSLQHEEDIMTAKAALFLKDGEEVFLERLKVGEGIVKIKGRVDPCFVKFPLVPIRKGFTPEIKPLPDGEKDMDTVGSD